MSDILMLLKCNGLAYDDRVRKECVSLSRRNLKPRILVIENDNEKSEGAVYEGRASFRAIKLLTRKLFPGNRLLFIKLLEFFVYIFPETIKCRQAVWLHDPLMFVFVPYFYVLKRLGRIEMVIWDQHELPPEYFLRHKILRKIYCLSLKLADIRVHANEERALFLNQQVGKSFDYRVLRNFVDETFSQESTQAIAGDILSWLAGEPYLLLQSGGYKVRCFEHVAEAVCLDLHVKCIVVGGYDQNLISSLRERFDNFDQFFWFTGMIPQLRLVDYIDPAMASLILYDSSSANSKYCEPNRLYYAISRRVPVIVGNNPTMANIVKNSNCGVVLDNDGSNPESITEGLQKFLCLKEKGFLFEYSCMWNSQDGLFDELSTRLG